MTIFSPIIERVSATGAELSQETLNTIRILDRPHYTIGVVGMFQVGKTKFLNEVFLRNNVLLEGIGICKTAVPTEVRYGATRRMTVFYRDTETAQPLPPGQEWVVDSPVQSDLEKATTATTDAERLELSRKTENVLLEWDCESLKGYSLIDTPGIDDPNQELLINTTYRIMPSVDMAVIVVQPQMLCQQVLKMLRTNILGRGISHFAILVSYDPKSSMSAKTRDDLVQTIQAQLMQNGIKNIPVKVICYDASVDGDVLNTPEAIQEFITNFLDERAGRARHEKVASLLKTDLRTRLLTLDTEAELLAQSNNDIDQAKRQLQHEETQLRVKFDTINNCFQSDVQQAVSESKVSFHKAAEAAIEQFVNSFDGLSLQQAKDRVNSVPTLLMPAIEQAITDELRQVKTCVETRMSHYGRQLEQDLSQVITMLPTSFSLHLVADGGLLARVPTIVTKIADYGFLTLVLGPLTVGLAPILTLILRGVAGQIPIIKDWLPAAFAGQFIKKAVKQSLDSQLPMIVQNYDMILQDFLHNSTDAISLVFADVHKQCIQPLIDAVDAAQRNQNDRENRVRAIRSEQETLKQITLDLDNLS